jgi:hypothetical protein
MSQPPPPPSSPYQPYQAPSPYGPPGTKSNKTLWIVLGVIAGVLVLSCGSGVVVFALLAKEVDDAIDEELENDTPRTVEVGAAFEHDDFEADGGWEVGRDAVGDFTIRGLRVTNREDTDRSAQLDFTVYRDDTVIATITCTSPTLREDEAGRMDCFSSDTFAGDFEEVKVADSY